MHKHFFTIFVFRWFIFIISSSVEAKCSSGITPRVALSTGCVEGLKVKTVLGRSIYSFRGIPYATPPVGELRFKAPKSPSRWPGILRAFEEPPACLQPSRAVEFPITYSEDCLYVNVFTPYLQHPSGKPMSVMVWIHGGKHYLGSASSYKYGADFLLMKDVILVTMNYRLGIFGFLNLNIPEAQGNAALKDIVAALRWVKKEISKFGGDPNSVTIFGGSSGASNVNLLYISPISKGLFARAISESGTANCDFGFLPSPLNLGLSFAHSLGCPTYTSHAAVSCLRVINGTDLAENQKLFYGVDGLASPFVPSIEADFGEEVFLSETPEQLMAKVDTGGIPYIIGINNGEGLMYVGDPRTNPNQFDNIEEKFVSYLPVEILKNESPKKLRAVTSSIKNFYFGNNNSLNETTYGFINLMTDSKFGYWVLKAAQIISTQAPVYLYYFTFEGKFERNNFHKLLNLSGVCHGEELGYIFYRNYSVLAHNNLNAYPREMDMVKNMVNLWTNFAIYGDPTVFDMNFTWNPVRGNLTNHLIIDDPLVMAPYSLLKKQITFWDNLYDFLSSDLSSIAGVTHYVLNISLILILIATVLGIVNYSMLRRKGYYFLN